MVVACAPVDGPVLMHVWVALTELGGGVVNYLGYEEVGRGMEEELEWGSGGYDEYIWYMYETFKE